ncbi:MAG: DUF3501 family protein [Caulobacterales bacterium]
MSAAARTITADDVMPTAQFALERKQRRAALLPKKKLRRVEVGPHCTFYFECYDTMLFQIQEMLLVEKGGAEQLVDELAAYNPLIPQGSELVATVMFEIEDPVRRANVLRRISGVENTLYREIGGERIAAVSETDVERTADDGKTSSVHFVRFPLSAAQITAWKSGEGQIQLGVSHPNYGHIAIVNAETRAELATDFA